MKGRTHNFITAPPVNSTSVIFIANSIETIEIKDIPIAVLKACRNSICLLKMKVSSIIDVIIPFIMASVMISHTGQSIPINWKYNIVPTSPIAHPSKHQPVFLDERIHVCLHRQLIFNSLTKYATLTSFFFCINSPLGGV